MKVMQNIMKTKKKQGVNCMYVRQTCILLHIKNEINTRKKVFFFQFYFFLLINFIFLKNETVVLLQLNKSRQSHELNGNPMRWNLLFSHKVHVNLIWTPDQFMCSWFIWQNFGWFDPHPKKKTKKKYFGDDEHIVQGTRL